MKSPLRLKIQFDKNGNFYYVNDYNKQQYPFCASHNYGGGSWAPDGCLDYGAINYFGSWFLDKEDK